MIIKSKRFKFRFNIDTFEFDSEFPQALNQVMDHQEFLAIFDKINGELNQDLIQSNKKFQNSAKVFAISSLFVIGFFYSPIMQHYYRKRQRQAAIFWDSIKEFLSSCNRRTFQKRRIEWRIVEDAKKMKGRDVVDPVLCYRIDIIQKFGKDRTGEDEDVPINREINQEQSSSIPQTQEEESSTSSSASPSPKLEPRASIASQAEPIQTVEESKIVEEHHDIEKPNSSSEESSLLAMPLEQ